MLSTRSACIVFASLAALTIGCQNRGELASASRAQMMPAQAAPPEPQPPQQTAAPAVASPMFAEQTIDTQVARAQPSTAPVLTTHDLKRSKVRTVADERLPKWVPVKGRLTVVDSSDLAENLGLVPQGTTKKSDERISVAEKLSEERAARATSDPMAQGTSWSYAKAGRVRNRR